MCLLEGRQPDSFAAEIRNSALIRSRAAAPVLRDRAGISGKGAFMSRLPGVEGRSCTRRAIGRWSIGAASFLRQLLVRRIFSSIGNCFELLRGVAADFASIASALHTIARAFGAITVFIQARGERRASRFNS